MASDPNTGHATPDGVTLAVYRTSSNGAGPDVELAPESTPGYAATVLLRNEHDLATLEGIESVLAPILGNVLVDLSECEFMDSTVISVLLKKSSELDREGYRIELVVPPANENVTRIVEVVGLRSLLTVHAEQPDRSSGPQAKGLVD
jgi:anti-anti-sigma factor